MLPWARHFLLHWSGELGRELSGWSEEVERYLLACRWPGNVRELENTIERGVVLGRGDRLDLDDLLVDAGELDSGRGRLRGLRRAACTISWIGPAADRIRVALREAGDVKVDAARALRIDRTTLYRRMRKYEIAES